MCLESVSSLTLGPSDIVGSSDFARSATIGSMKVDHGIHMLLNWTVILFHVQLFTVCNKICHQGITDSSQLETCVKC